MRIPAPEKDCFKKLPLGNSSFSAIRKAGQIYADKTAMIADLADNEDAPVFLMRPRGFGKSLLVSALESLFSKGLADFKGLEIATGENRWRDTAYRVVRFDLSAVANSSPASFKTYLNNKMISEIYGNNHYLITSGQNETGQPGVILSNICDDQAIPDKSIVFLVDDYDAPITGHLGKSQELSEISDILYSFFAGIKFAERILRFVFIAGITRTGREDLFSSRCNAYDISTDDDFGMLLGITEDELRRYFDPWIKNAAAVLGMSIPDVYAKMKSVYGGFQFSIGNEETVYNPRSVISFLSNPENGFRNYWRSVSGNTPDVLLKYLQKADNRESLIRLSDSVKDEKNRDNIVAFDEIMAKAEPGQIPMKILLLETGYFTLRSNNFPYGRIAVPNEEVSESLSRLSLKAQS